MLILIGSNIVDPVEYDSEETMTGLKEGTRNVCQESDQYPWEQDCYSNLIGNMSALNASLGHAVCRYITCYSKCYFIWCWDKMIPNSDKDP